jgi:8-oxo-dGTP diphosphatase
MNTSFAVILLTNHEGKILLQHRADDASRSPGKWGFFGGEIEKDESPLEGVIRECTEELTYELKNPKYLDSVEVEGATIHVFSEAFREEEALEQKEGQGMDWYSRTEIEDLDMIPHDKKIIMKY